MNNNNTKPSFSMPEIWQFPINNNSSNNTASFGDLSGNCMDLDINIENDMIMSNGAVRKLRDEDDGNGKGVSTSCNGHDTNENDCKRMKTTGAKENQEGEGNSGKAAQGTAKSSEPSKKDYIHVRSRRGQATDSHSLAERARREKIGERMKTLQDLVPGCNKVIGKALVLDEIINYVQSLQHQVEFLSMKLEAVNSRVPPNIEGFPLKDFGQQQAFDTSGLAFSTQATQDYRGTSPEWLHMQLGGGFERT